MKILLTLFMSWLVCVLSSKKHKNIQADSFENDSNESYEKIRKNTSFDLRGKLKRSFALEAVLTDPQENVLCSPLSALLPLGKLVFGAEGLAREEIIAAIGISKRKNVKTAFNKMIRDLQYLPEVTLDIASRIYMERKVKLNPDFSNNVKSIFQSDVERLSFENPREAVDQINSWVARQTKNIIPKILAPGDISPSTSIVLVNAIYFAGKWKHPFDRLFSATFWSRKGPIVIPMIMSTGKRYNHYYSEILKAQIIELPYAGNNASFIMVLPTMKDGLQLLLRSLKLAPEILNSEMRKFVLTNVEVRMPKFKIQTEMDLKILYEKIGVRIMFNNKNSGLTGIVQDEVVYVSKAIHKAVIEVNELGTKGAAVSSASIFTLALVPVTKFTADHPFLFFVKVNDEQLFAGIFNGG